MKAHPGSAMLHVRLKRSSLCRVFRTGIQKNHDLILSEKVRIQIVPIRRGVIAEMVFGRRLRKPALDLMQEADVCRIFFARVERDHAKRRLAPTGGQACTTIDQRTYPQGLEGSHGSPDTLAVRLDVVRHTELLPEIDVAQ